ncbi:uncharacterized protein [Amphiura filiformis]|uniref:uncharacterized protein n=1 Tax=Amphiura filiformis TaxID=82378 RepID=UPI003B215D05
MKPLAYSRKILLQINKSVINNDSFSRLDNCSWNKLKELDINKRMRGSRAGRNKIRIIDNSVTRIRRDDCFTPKSRCVNKNNLIPVKFSSCYKQSIRARFSHWNARSIGNKTASICDFVISNKLDVFAITESWLNGDSKDDKALADLQSTLPDFDSYSIPRCDRGGGGVFLLLRKGFKVIQNPRLNFNSFEMGDFTIASASSSMRLVVVYRLRPDKKNKLTANMFFNEFPILLESLATGSSNLLLVGDFNFHVDVSTDREAIKFLDLLDSANLHQHVVGPTHIHGHTLDLIFTPKDVSLVSGDIAIQRELPSDHFATTCNIDIARPASTKQRVKVRRYRSVDITQLKQDILTSSLTTDPENDINSLAVQYDAVLRELMDKHAPLKTRTRILRPHSPWYSDDLRAKKQELRRSERKWISSGLEVHRQIFNDKSKQYKTMLDCAKTAFHRSQILDCDHSNLSTTCVSLRFLTCCHLMTLLRHWLTTLSSSLTTKLRTFVRTLTLFHLRTHPTIRHIHIAQLSLVGGFHALAEDDVRKLISKMASKTCSLDPMPTWMLKLCLNELLPVITRIINYSLLSGVFSDCFKIAHVIPLLKKATLDAEQLNSYRSVSNLSFMSKVVEKAAAEQIQAYLINNNLYSNLQSAYRKHHSTESALLRVMNDILLTVDKREDAVLVLLDLSAAFDTIGHTILLQRLKHQYGITGTSLSWFESYMHGRKQAVKIGDTLSSFCDLTCGVPQGSVFGPQIFTMYAAPIENVVRDHQVQGMSYADDSQLYVSFNADNRNDNLVKLEACVNDIKKWTVENKLALNDDKTEVIHIRSRYVDSDPIGDFKVAYIRELVVIKDPVRSLRSNVAPQLHHTSVNTVTYGQRSFKYAAPELWNQLPPHIRNSSSLALFKKKLKTHLFIQLDAP